MLEFFIQSLSTVLLFYVSLTNLYCHKVHKRTIIHFIAINELVSSFFFVVFELEVLSNASLVIIPIMFLYSESRNLGLSVCISILNNILIFVVNIMVHNCIWYILGEDIIREDFFIYSMNFVITFLLTYYASKYLGWLISKKILGMLKSLKVQFLIYITLSLIVTLLLFYLNYSIELEKGAFAKSVLRSLLFIAYFIILSFAAYYAVTNAKNTLEILHKQELLQNLQDYTTNIESLYNEMRGFRHDHINILASIHGYVRENDMVGLEKYLNHRILPESKRIERLNNTIDRLRNICILELKGLIFVKVLEAQNYGINVHVEIKDIVKFIQLDELDLSRIVGILMDNAIEECQKDAQHSEITFAITEYNDKVILFFINSINYNPPKIPDIFENGYSTKGDGRGTGLFFLKQTIGKYNNIFLNTYIEDSLFFQELMIYNRDSEN